MGHGVLSCARRFRIGVGRSIGRNILTLRCQHCSCIHHFGSQRCRTEFEHGPHRKHVSATCMPSGHERRQGVHIAKYLIFPWWCGERRQTRTSRFVKTFIKRSHVAEAAPPTVWCLRVVPHGVPGAFHSLCRVNKMS